MTKMPAFTLAPALSAEDALNLAAQHARYLHNEATLQEPKLSYYPLLGTAFQVVARRGPARKVAGARMFAAVDLVSGTPLVMEDWTNSEQSTPEGAILLEDLISKARVGTTDEAINIARQALSTKLLGKLKLASMFELSLIALAEPLWKPNWCVRTHTHEFLVDALAGNVVSRSLVMAER
ncbi:hypothetical protein NQ015_07140 [Corynebacterium sp. 153RC1]|uniref:hypothetical protein n=1 Tax=Corynebacterium TaxID=1716 RepID=UPI00211CCF4C|nr:MULTISPECIES: hypothetical protein [unclassified Corynebacterium]MCQ9342991.1 hypothetical protein [Corynebacterium sp. 76QC2CO]MCQ9352706.1 hypothetical protein [Corynebacterium sp. 209RC1]MCQ9354890.1 hypothetical protein [Corynebacterium sp. 1222RC1]MCQ9357075.1 hypothetical protein [Corynebacterium sp. 122RC1]MCQ9359321.1 hypothetical protein [Corynebacterium sp. 142RC1]